MTGGQKLLRKEAQLWLMWNKMNSRYDQQATRRVHYANNDDPQGSVFLDIEMRELLFSVYLCARIIINS